jgi:hypothetical protein
VNGRWPKSLAAAAGTLLIALLVPLAHPGSSPADQDGRADTSQMKEGSPAGRSAVLVMVPGGSRYRDGFDPALLDQLADTPGLSVGLMSATQGTYSREQALLDISQGTRVSRSTYSPADPPPVGLRQLPGGGASLRGWQAVVERADSAPQRIRPGLLAGSVPDGAALLLTPGDSAETAIPAADRKGRVDRLLPLPKARASRFAGRVAGTADERRFTVVSTRPGLEGVQQLRQILEGRPEGQLVIVIQSPPPTGLLPLLPIATTGGNGTGEPGAVTSDTTNFDGLVAGIDIGPTVLEHLGIEVPAEMVGTAIETTDGPSPQELVELRQRLREVGPRRTPVLLAVGVGWLFLFLAAGAILGRERARLPVRRIGGLSVLWLPTVILVPGALGTPSTGTELLLVAGLCLGLGFLTDRLAPWPRAPLVPAVVGLVVITADLALGTNLVTRSALGPNPGYGSRFYGIGNELKSGLTVLMLAGVAAAITGWKKSGRSALVVVVAGLLLGVILGSGRLGAGVGAVIIVAAATAVAAVMMLPGGMTRGRIALLAASPFIGLGILAVIDLLTADGKGHLSRNVIGADSWEVMGDTVRRRTTLAWQQLIRDAMPVATAAALLTAVWGIRNRAVLMPFPGPIWPAILVGGLVGGLIGSVAEDSGPLLLIGAVITLAGVWSYLSGRPGTESDRSADGPDQLQAESVASLN